MKNFVVLVIIFISIGFSSCDNDSSQEPTQNYLTINGVQQLLGGQEGVNIYYNGGGFTFDNLTGETTSRFTQLVIEDQNQLFLPNYNAGFTESLRLRFITHPETVAGSHNTINNTPLVGQTDVIAEYFVNGEASIYADAGQNVNITISDNMTVIRFSNISYGNKVMSGKFVIPY